MRSFLKTGCYILLFWGALRLDHAMGSLDQPQETRAPLAEKNFLQNIDVAKLTSVVFRGRILDVKLIGVDPREHEKFHVSLKYSAKDLSNLSALSKVDPKIFVSKDGSTLIIQGSSGDHVFQDPLTCKLVLPKDLHVRLVAGKIDADLKDMGGNVNIEAGSLKLQGKGEFERVSVIAGQADIQIDSVRGDFFLFCGQATVQANMHLPSPEEKPKGLSFSRPPIITLRMGLGNIRFMFPHFAKLAFKQEVPGLHADQPPVRKGFDAKVFVFTSPTSNVFLEHHKQDQKTPDKNQAPLVP